MGWDSEMNLPAFPLEFPTLLSEGIHPDILMRLAFAMVAGTVLGIERERHGRAAGLRTQLLVCLAACIAMILSDQFYHRSLQMSSVAGSWHPDPARLAAGVLAGMGFLGAGVIIRQSTHVIRGVTTAATLWFVTIIGMAFGAGSYGLGILSTVAAFTILILFPYLETWIKNDWYSDLGITFSPSLCSVDEIVKAFTPLGVKVKGVELLEILEEDSCRATFHLKYKRVSAIGFSSRLFQVVRGLPGVTRISFQE
jgi:putative Mg2+ transporter-C (MgtC) family protein